MRDPYLYENSHVLKNKLDIRTQEELDDAEADYVVYRLKDLAMNPMPGEYNTEHLLKMHQYIFQDLYEWAGEPRIIAIYKEEDVLGGMSVEYSDPFDITKDIHFILADMRQKPWNEMDRKQATTEFCDSLARLWKVHPFREGNTRTTITFCCQYADEIGLSEPAAVLAELLMEAAVPHVHISEVKVGAGGVFLKHQRVDPVFVV